jgi:hypothetical protein
MLGFRPLPPGDPLLASDPGLPDVNGYLPAYDAWHRQVDAWMIVQVGGVMPSRRVWGCWADVVLIVESVCQYHTLSKVFLVIMRHVVSSA